MEPATSQSPISDVPDQILCSVFACLPSSTLFKSVAIVCKRWSSLVRDHPQLATSVSFNFRYASEKRHSVKYSQHGVRFIPCKKIIKRWLSTRAEYITQLTVSNTENHGPEDGCALQRHDFAASDWSKLLCSLPNLTSLSFDCANDILPNLHFLSQLTKLQDLSLQKANISFASERGWMRNFEPVPGSSFGGAPLLAELTNLTRLVIGMDPPTADGLHKLPDAWSTLEQLQVLKLSGHYKLKDLPKWMKALTNIQSISLVQCDFKRVPPALDYFPNLTELDLSCNELDVSNRNTLRGSVPDAFVQLEHLRLHDCELNALPACIARMSRLVSLDMSGNPLSAFKDTNTFFASGWEAWGLFDDLKYCTALEALDLSQCSLDRLPPGLCHLTSLKALNLSKNKALWLSEAELMALKSLPLLLDLNLHQVRMSPPARPGHFIRQSAKQPWRIESLTEWDSRSHDGFLTWLNQPTPLLTRSYSPGVFSLYSSGSVPSRTVAPQVPMAEHGTHPPRFVGWSASSCNHHKTANVVAGSGLNPYAAEFVPAQPDGASSSASSSLTASLQTGGASGSALFASILPNPAEQKSKD